MSYLNRSMRPLARAAGICSRSSRQVFTQQRAKPCTPIWRAAPCRSAYQVSAFSSTARIQQASEAHSANEIVQSIEELYDAASEEFQMAAEETEENTIYAEDDRAAARELVDQLTTYYRSVQDNNTVPQEIKDEVKRRAGTRIRELENAMVALEEAAMNHD